MRSTFCYVLSVVSFFIVGTSIDLAYGQLNFAYEELVLANGVDIQVPGYSVPSLVDWNNDGLKDLVIGQGSGSSPAKVRVYLNVGTESDPAFSDYFYAQSGDSDLTVTAGGCLGCFPRVVYWDADVRKDLLLGMYNGLVKIYLNVGTDENPTFDSGTTLQVGCECSGGPKTDINVGSRATPSVVDWDNDNRKDLVVGAYDGRIRLYLNEGTDTEPDFRVELFIQENDLQLSVPNKRSSPVVFDFDGDGKKDLLTGDTNGQILFYPNVGTDAEPTFSGYSLVQSDGTAIDLPGVPRSRPSVCYWTGSMDFYPDLLVGAGDGKVHLYRRIAGDINGDGVVDFVDFALLAMHWRQTNCGQCSGADLTGDGAVNFDDLRELLSYWLGDTY